MPDLITLKPDPPIQGQDVEICYDFPQGVDEVDLKVTFTPGGTTTHRVTAADPCVDVPVPDDATTILVQDMSGASADKAAPVVPTP